MCCTPDSIIKMFLWEIKLIILTTFIDFSWHQKDFRVQPNLINFCSVTFITFRLFREIMQNRKLGILFRPLSSNLLV